MAVDRAKFRTCAQTSFCRRHRGGKSRRLYEYRLLGDSVRVHRGAPDADADPADADPPAPGAPEGGGLLSRAARRLLDRLAPSPDDPAAGDPDPHVLGPAPLLTATLANAAPFTSTALSARANGGCPGATFDEALELSVHLHADGVARLRLREVADGGARAVPRWTADELVLNAAEMVGARAEDVRVAATAPAVRRRLAGEDGEGENGDAAADARLIASLTRRADLEGSAENYVVLSYGGPGGEEEWQLMLQMAPFAAYFFRAGDAGPPLVVAGGGGLTHFEVRRRKDCAGAAAAPKRQLTEFDVDDGEEDDDDEEEEGEEEDRHGGKEITGYWEDGLAIYADGSREERRDAAPAADAAVEAGRRLAEEDFDTDGMWDEKFGDHHDSKPFGPMSVGMELEFPASRHLFGLPEHASSTQLKATMGEGRHYEEPYRLYNLDVFEYELDETMALYGHIPLVVSQSPTSGTAGAFWFNPTETFVDVAERGEGDAAASTTHFVSESGIVDLFLLPGPDPAALYAQYARLTGRPALPPMFALGYHQCRWNYRDDADVRAVHAQFEALDYPYDVLWLDIEHTDGKRYFTWDKSAFPDPEAMQRKLGADGRRMVTIVDPHIKRDNHYYIHKEATALGLYIKDKKGGKDYDGWCWPGSSSYLDFTQEKVRNWWAAQFGYDKYRGSTPDLFTWNDMNEPSVFNGPEVSMQKDLRNLDGREHREWHNLYGMLFQRATAEGLVQRNEGANIRPFVLSRSFFAGSQRYGAVWTGDNEAKWSHLAIATPMLLSLNVGALPFVGADVGGFFGNTDAELMERWMQAGAYTPFFRGHAHHDAKRREPWTFGEETLGRLRRSAMARYALLPYWYTVFWQGGATGMPVMRTMWMQYPQVSELYSVDDQYLIGSDLLVKPVTSAGAVTSSVRFPLADCWYDIDTMQRMALPAEAPVAGEAHVNVTVGSDIEKIPVYQRGGSIIPRKLRLRRSSKLMMHDPYTLYVALGRELTAKGTLYMDDETTFDHEKRGDFGVASFASDWDGKVAARNSVRFGSDDGTNNRAAGGRIVERIVVMGVPSAPRGITLKPSAASLEEARALEFQYDAATQVLVIRKPEVSALEEWTMELG